MILHLISYWNASPWKVTKWFFIFFDPVPIKWIFLYNFCFDKFWTFRNSILLSLKCLIAFKGVVFMQFFASFVQLFKSNLYFFVLFTFKFYFWFYFKFWLHKIPWSSFIFKVYWNSFEWRFFAIFTAKYFRKMNWMYFDCNLRSKHVLMFIKGISFKCKYLWFYLVK